MEDNICPLCKRALADPMSRHHLIPLSQGGSGEVTVMMHRVCHNKVHSIFNEKELARDHRTVEKILENEDIQKFVKWVQKKPLDFYDGSIKAKK
jgi:5-methylcytosine-specific restriction endonuclease McrA